MEVVYFAGLMKKIKNFVFLYIMRRLKKLNSFKYKKKTRRPFKGQHLVLVNHWQITSKSAPM